MAIRPIDLQITARDSSASVLRRVTDNLKGIATEALKSARATNGLTASLTNTGNTGRSLSTVKGHIEQLGRSMEEAKKHSSDLKTGLENIRNAGAGLALAGAGGLALSEHFIAAGLEADHLAGKMGALLSGAGLSQASDEIKKLGNEIAALTGQDDDIVSANIARAVASGRTMALKEYGIVLSGSAKDAIKAASAISDLAGKQETLKQVMLAGSQAVKDLRANTSDTAAQIGEFNVRWGNLEESIGMGAARSKAAILGGLLSPIMATIEASPGLQDTAGAILYVGSAGASAVGGIVSLGAQVGILTTSFPALGASGVAAFTAIRAAAFAALPAIAAVTAGIAAGVTIANSEGWKRITNIGTYREKTAQLNKVLGDPKASKDYKRRILEEAIGDFGEAGLTSDVAELQKQYKGLTGREYDPAAKKMSSLMAAATKAMPATSNAAYMGAALSPGTTTAASSLSGPNIATGGMLVDSGVSDAAFVKRAIEGGAYITPDGRLVLPEIAPGRDMQPTARQAAMIRKRLGAGESNNQNVLAQRGIFGALAGLAGLGGGNAGGAARGGGGAGDGGGEITARGHGRGTIQNDGRIRIVFDDIVIDSPGRQLSRNIAALPLAPGF